MNTTNMDYDNTVNIVPNVTVNVNQEVTGFAGLF
jgi:hypothetical protein